MRCGRDARTGSPGSQLRYTIRHVEATGQCAGPSGDMTDQGDLTHGHLLDGRVRYAQPRRGFRSGIEPVLLAAAIPAVPVSRILEGGSGAGAALLCLAARVAGVQGLGIEQDPTL